MSTFYSFPAKPSKLTRRQFIGRSTLAASLAAMSAPALLRGQNLNSKLNIASVGVGGKGGSDSANCAELGENMYAICDVDKNTLEGAAKRKVKVGDNQQEVFANAARYSDYRKMFEEMGKSIDAVTVSTPDHHHAFAAGMAMKLGKPVYVQKPLAHSVSEARYLRGLAKQMKVATQMGNQGSAMPGLRRAVEVIQSGVIGQVSQLHVWSNRPIWPQGIDRPEGSDPVPETLDWEQWIGPAPMRPYKEYPADDKGGKKRRGSGVYHPFNWRGWQDFGTGALGDMACHTVNMPFRALKLGYPISIEAKSTGINHETYPLSSQIHFEFPKREGLIPVSFTWYDGKPGAPETLRPGPDITEDIIALKKGTLPGSGCLLIGEKGRIFSDDDYGVRFYIRFNDEKEMKPSETKVDGASVEHEAIRNVPKTIPRLEGSNYDLNQKKEWLEAIRTGKPSHPFSNFDIAAYLTEIILLGCVALRVGKKLDWDGPKMVAKNAPEAAKYVKREYRSGWKLA